VAFEDVTTEAGETDTMALGIEPAEYETDQIDTADAFDKGDKVYWDSANSRFTTVATDGEFCGVVTSAKDGNNVVWFVFVPPQDGMIQAAAQADSVAGDVAAIVADFNALLAKLRAANLMAT